MIGFLLFSIRRAGQGLVRNGLMTVAATATMALMLMLLSGFWVIRSGLAAGLEFVEQKVEVVADLRDGTTPAEADDLRGRVAEMPEVAGVVFVSRDEALARFREYLASQGEEDLTQYLGENPLRASLEVRLRDPRAFAPVIERLRADPAVETARDIGTLVERVITVTDVLRTVGLVVLIVVAIIVLFIIVNTIRLAVVARADEIEIMRLVGASDSFIRWPFVFEGAFIGLLGATITLGALAVLSRPLGDFMFDFFRLLPLQLGQLTRDVALLVLVTGTGLGILGSWVSVRTYLIK
jgi:cell division transport system permease protein